MIDSNKIFVSTLVLNKIGEMETLVSNGVGIEIFAEGPEWDDLDKGFKVVKDIFKNYPCSFDLNLASSYPVIRKLTTDIYKNVIEKSSEIGCHYIVFHTHNYSAHIFNKKEVQKRVKDTLYELSNLANRVGVKMLIENVGFGPSQLFDEKEFVEVIYEIDNIGALLDVGHAYINRWNIPGVISRLGYKLEALHIHDNKGQSDEHRAIGKGAIEFFEIWKSLNNTSSNPVLVLEYYNVSLERTLKDVEFLRKIAREVINTNEKEFV
ncbi:sugar phosphate isomerase/epimerase [Thermoanaerobacter kivui]|uniref:Sugar phosphate isomerase/epimerase n=1 Tax=Thermoanaerobacter kivui TaxID=2325 RepID=A0A097AP66_THEKI|nr:sugar phosphate isomerase/epimerase [Thermoanaerobacter kivui]AIS51629.1 sugar phosphate isomerase/epimerase [Thermoanaerobacter kivui]